MCPIPSLLNLATVYLRTAGIQELCEPKEAAAGLRVNYKQLAGDS